MVNLLPKQIRDSTKLVLKQIKELTKINPGWHFGLGDPVDKDVASKAKKIAKYIIKYGFNVEVLPGLEGEIIMVVFQKPNPDKYLEVTISKSDKDSYIFKMVKDIDRWNLVDDWEDVSTKDIFKIIDKFIEGCL